LKFRVEKEVKSEKKINIKIELIMTRLKRILFDKEMTQKELAKLSDVEEYKISLLCSGKAKDVSISTARRICDVLQVSLDEAFGDVIK
jgi:DNA-binding Xre family transcriptional regulator